MREKERTLEIACIHARIARNVSKYWPTRNEHGRARWRDNRRRRRRRIRHHLSDRSRGRGASGEASGLAGPGRGEVRDNQSCHTGLLRARARATRVSGLASLATAIRQQLTALTVVAVMTPEPVQIAIRATRYISMISDSNPNIHVGLQSVQAELSKRHLFRVFFFF